MKMQMAEAKLTIMNPDQVSSFQHALAQLQGIQTDLLNAKLPEPGQDGEISDCVLSHLKHAVCPAFFFFIQHGG